MSNLYELICKLVRRGMSEHPRLDYRADEPYGPWFLSSGHCDVDPMPMANEDDARAIWTAWALQWWRGLDARHNVYWPHTWCVLRRGSKDIARELAALEAIEAATRHLEP